MRTTQSVLVSAAISSSPTRDIPDGRKIAAGIPARSDCDPRQAPSGSTAGSPIAVRGQSPPRVPHGPIPQHGNKGVHGPLVAESPSATAASSQNRPVHLQRGNCSSTGSAMLTYLLIDTLIFHHVQTVSQAFLDGNRIVTGLHWPD